MPIAEPVACQSGDLLKKSVGSASGKIAIQGLFQQASGSAVEAYGSGTTTKIGKDWIISTTAGLGVWVDTAQIKKFIVKINSKTGNLGRIRIACYDAAGALLTNAGAGHPYARALGSSLSGSTQYGYSYATGADSSRDLQFQVGPTVAKIKLLFTAGSAALYIRSFQLEGYAGGVTGLFNLPNLNIYSGLDESDDAFFCQASPATIRGGGPVARGATFENALAASGGTQPAFWKCTGAGVNAKAHAVSTVYIANEMAESGGNVYACVVAGTSGAASPPTGTGFVDGTVTFGYLEAAASFGGTSVAYANSTAYAVGAYVNAGGNIYVVRVAGTSAGAGAGPTGTYITDGTVQWDYYRPLATFTPGPLIP
jgi:hypothetical protein